MTAAAVVNALPDKSVGAPFNYFLDESLGGSRILYSPTASLYRRKHDSHVVKVQDIRGAESNFSLDIQGFQICEQPSTEKAFEDEAVIKTTVYDEAAELVKKM